MSKEIIFVLNKLAILGISLVASSGKATVAPPQIRFFTLCRERRSGIGIGGGGGGTTRVESDRSLPSPPFLTAKQIDAANLFPSNSGVVSVSIGC